jgi:uncharacterized membrane protein
MGGMVPVVTSRGGASRRRLLLLWSLFVASAALALGCFLRVLVHDSLELTNLVLNLFLAWIPFVVALALYDSARRGASSATLVVLGGVWLVFLPNAPYIVTDIVWLGDLVSGTYWYDPILIAYAAAIGLVLGFLSLYLVQTVVADRIGRAAGWTVAFAALVLSGLGVYLGRYERWNSWEVLTEPSKIFGGLASGLADPLAYPKPIALSIFFAVSCCAGYALFYSLLGPHLRRLDDH